MNLNEEEFRTFVTEKDATIDQVENKSASRLKNWNILLKELDIVGIIISSDSKNLYVAGELEEIIKLFARLDKYFTRITLGDSILDFDNYRVAKCEDDEVQKNVEDKDDGEVLIDDQEAQK